jgi:hypothetical protein
MQDFSRGNLQSGDMRIFDLLGLGAGAAPAARTALKGGGLLGKEALRQMNEGTGLLGKVTIDPRMYAVTKTDYEKAFDLAQKRAALPVKEGGLGLPADNTAMDRAEAMGFDVNNPAYHGTSADISAFNPALSDTARKTGTPSGAMVVSSNPKTANTYTQGYVGDFTEEYLSGGNILPLYIRKGKNLSMNASEPNYTPNWNDIYNPKYPNISTTNEFANLAKSKGKESATIKNVKDNARMSSAEGDTTFLFNPNQLRSINAAFDPFRRNENDLLAGVAAAPVGLINLKQETPKKKRTRNK